ncbi:MAG: cupin domain-containing protein [bacterium]
MAVIDREERRHPNNVSMEGAHLTRIARLFKGVDQSSGHDVREFVIESGGYTPCHEHSWHHLIVVLEGTVRLKQGEDSTRSYTWLESGDVVYIPPGERHQLRNESSESVKFLCLIPEGSGA